MTSLATPSRGSTEVSAWTVAMEPGAAGPLHAMDREQLWVPLSGAITVTTDDGTRRIGPGRAAILPAGENRRIATSGTAPAEVLVCMANGGRATVADTGEVRPLHWAG
ncbi:cupin domain-containing protein [Streptomyces sp. MP131-18]|uniref:cupin domain-containing protein n=1 Tax=Streptomyces sp. MP131-18 TaxID=1857892 RepID=UPI00097C7407|nr:cupin domain-containing protein [Streptomyces sp. MP131-18]ONK11973.1 Cupin domain protein [Streptomyces sp. MP131-18]